MQGYIEVRGIVNKDGTLSFGEYTQYDNEFGKFKHLFKIKNYKIIQYINEILL